MSWIKNIFSKSTASVIESTGNALDKILTSDEERIQAKAQFKIGIEKLINEAQAEANNHIETMEKELTKRQDNDMKSDSWLSKNIRPMTLIFMTLSSVILAFSTVFYDGFTAQQAETVDTWAGFFQMIMITIYGFYFGSRGWEKVNNIKKDK